MSISMSRRTRWLFAPLLLLAAGLIAAACSSGGVDQDDFDALRAQVGQLQTEVADFNATLAATEEAAQRALLFAILPAFNTSAFHTIDEQINNDGLIHATTPGTVQRALEAIASADWPEALQPNVDQYREALEALIEPVLDNDSDAAGRPATVVHALTHAFEGSISAFLDGEEVPPPPDLGSDGEHNDHEASEGDEEMEEMEEMEGDHDE
ncbi:MAG TPA: hypothetical protein QGF05_07390 [Dehalococcoidia bacterium]|nr:hypothetical protein [Dehalococcoidia bacterium]